jgi:hypothetical protein
MGASLIGAILILAPIVAVLAFLVWAVANS